MKSEPIYIVSTEETYPYGQMIYEEGSSGDWVYIVLSGLVEVYKNVRDKKYIIEIMQPGDIFGVMEYIGQTKRMTSVRSIGMTTLGLIDREFLDREYNQLSAQLRSILETMSRRSLRILNRYSDIVSLPEPRKQKILPLLFSDGEKTFRAHTAEVGEKGLFIVTNQLLNQGKEFPVKLLLPIVSDPLQILCEVAWIKKREDGRPDMPSGMSVKFNKISKKDYMILKKFLSRKGAEGA